MTTEKKATKTAIKLVKTVKETMENTQPAELFAALIMAREEISEEEITYLLGFCLDIIKSAHVVGLFPPKFLESTFENILKEEPVDAAN